MLYVFSLGIAMLAAITLFRHCFSSYIFITPMAIADYYADY